MWFQHTDQIYGRLTFIQELWSDNN
jgi:hypothetical protein